MANWKISCVAVTKLHLDTKNPRLGSQASTWSPREIIQYLFDHDKAFDIADSIATRGFFANEPLLAVKEDGKYIVVEGNRRLAALKALRQPQILEGSLERRVEVLSRKIGDLGAISTVPVAIAPSRRATDRQVAGRHIGTPVLPWQAENKASFILEKLEEGYDNRELQAELGFSATDIQKARQTRAIADMARSVDLEEKLRMKLDSPRTKVFTTLGRVFDSSVGRRFLMVEPDPETGLRGTTTKKQFLRGFTKLVTDVASGKATSRKLNTTKDMEAYFNSWDLNDRPERKRGTFVPSDITGGKAVTARAGNPSGTKPQKKGKQQSKTVLPRDLNVRVDNDRLVDIRRELVKLKREDFPNAGAVLLRVFFELSVEDYLERSGEYQKIVDKLTKKGGRLPYGGLTLKQMLPTIRTIADKHLSEKDATLVKKALKYDASAPFTITDLHAFVHSRDLPGERDIFQFWSRIEPLLRLILEQDVEDLSK